MPNENEAIMKRMVGKTEIISVWGDLFSYEEYGIAGLAGFIPTGLTAIRSDMNHFIKKITRYVQWLRWRDHGRLELTETQMFQTDLKAFIAIDNGREDKRINSVDDMRRQIEETLNAFKEQGIRTIGMNGIRCDERPDTAIPPEQYQISFIEEWIRKNPDAFNQIFLFDLRGGFNK